MDKTINLLAEQNAKLDIETKDALKNKVAEITQLKLSASSDYCLQKIINEIISVVQELGYSTDKLKVGRPTLKNQATAEIDLAFNVSMLKNNSEESIEKIAEEVINKVKAIELVKSTENVGAFVNIKLDHNKFGENVLKQVSDLAENYGHYRDSDPILIIVEYSSTNVAKNMTAAHLRSTIIGQALANIHEASGNIPFCINHLGDWGTQFGNIIYEYYQELDKRGDEFTKELEKDPTGTLMRIYRQFNARKDSDPEAVKQAQQIFLELEHGKPEYVALWDKFKTWSLEEFQPIYDRLGVKFDTIQGESFYEDRMASVIQEGLDKNVLKKDDRGAVVFPSQPLIDPVTKTENKKIMLDENNNPKDEIILKPSGGSVYLTRDLATVRYRCIELKADKLLYVVGKEQKSHFLMLFAMADQLNYAKLGHAEHISFGHFNIGGQKMKSRSGQIALLNDILDESIEAAANMLKSKKSEGEVKELSKEELEIAQQVGIGSVIFNDLKQSREKDIEFVPDQAKALEMGSAAYIQYAHARANSILRKVGSPDKPVQIPPTISQTEQNLILEISELPLIIREAAQTNAPHKIANYLTNLSQLFNVFYTDYPIAKAESKELQNFRLCLVKSTVQVLQNAARLLQLPLPENM